MMEEVDGFEFAENVRSTNKEIPILFMTGLDDMESKSRGFRAGVDDYLVKPFEFEELYLRINALLRRAKISMTKMLTDGNVIMDAEAHAVKEKLWAAIKKILFLPPVPTIIIFVISMTFVAFALSSENMPDALKYAAYGLSAYGLAIFVLRVKPAFHAVKKAVYGSKIYKFLQSNKFTQMFLNDMMFKGTVSLSRACNEHAVRCFQDNYRDLLQLCVAVFRVGVLFLFRHCKADFGA